MYRFTPHLSQSHLVLVRKKLSDGSCAALVVMRAPVRRYAKEHFTEKCPEVAPVRKSRKFLYGVIGATLMTGAAVVYAKQSKEARGFLERNLPWANDFVALVYQENTTYLDFTLKHLDRAKVSITGFLFGKEGISPMDFQQRADQDIEKDAAIGFAPKTYPSTLVQTEKCEPAEQVKVNITKEVLALEQDMHKYTRHAIDTYKKGTKLSADFNKALQKVIELPPGNPHLYSTIKGLRSERDRTTNEANESAAKARNALEELDKMLKEHSISAPPENLTRMKRFIVAFRNDLDKAETDFKEEMKKSDISTKYWEKVEAARLMFKDELQALFPGVDLCAPTLDLRGDIDLFVLFCMHKVQFLENGIAQMQTTLENKINKAIECNDEKTLIEAKAQEMIMKDRIVKELEFQKRALKIMSDAHMKEKSELRKQFEAQERVAEQKIARMEAEVAAKANRQASEEIEKERVKFKKEVAAMAGKLKAIEQTLKQRSAAEAEARRSQSIWAAAEALLQATRRCSTTTKVDNEVKALAKAGEKDKLVQTVIKGIPKDAFEKGIATEKALKERFDVLEQTATKVALVGRSGGSLPLYFMSWVQSKLLFQKFASIPQNELDNVPTDFTKLDTFDIIHRARYHMDHGDLSAALRYVNLLQGAPRAAATCWVQAARDHLEVKQAAETVMAHASLSGMLYS